MKTLVECTPTPLSEEIKKKKIVLNIMGSAWWVGMWGLEGGDGSLLKQYSTLFLTVEANPGSS